MALSLLPVILISAGALIFADVSFGILGSISSTYLIRPVAATTDEFGDCVPGPAENNPLPCVMATPEYSPGGTGTSSRCGPGQVDMFGVCIGQTSGTTTTTVIECRAPTVNVGGVCINIGPPPCQQGFNCPGDLGGPSRDETPPWNPMDTSTWNPSTPPYPDTCDPSIASCGEPAQYTPCESQPTLAQQEQCQNQCRIGAAQVVMACGVAAPEAVPLCLAAGGFLVQDCYERCELPHESLCVATSIE